MTSLPLPPAEPLNELSAQLEEAMKREDRKAMQQICNAIAKNVAEFFKVKPPAVRIYGARPLEDRGDIVDETFGDYDFETARIRLWMRTARLEKVTAFGTFLSTLCHEICHHLDVAHLGLPNTYHTRGFYERAGVLYHHIRRTPVRKLVWDQLKDGRFSINWPRTMRSKGADR